MDERGRISPAKGCTLVTMHHVRRALAISDDCRRAGLRAQLAGAWLLSGLVVATGLAGCQARARRVEADAGESSAADAHTRQSVRSPTPPAYPPPEYTEPAPKLVVRPKPTIVDASGDSLQGGSEGFRFVAKTVLLESKAGGWTLSVHARDVPLEEWFMETRSPQFSLRVGSIALGPGVSVSGALATSSTLSFQSISPTLGVQGYSTRVSYFVIIDSWNVTPFAGRWAEAGRATGRLYFYLEPHACAGCFKGAQLAGAFEARVRYFAAPP